MDSYESISMAGDVNLFHSTHFKQQQQMEKKQHENMKTKRKSEESPTIWIRLNDIH